MKNLLSTIAIIIFSIIVSSLITPITSAHAAGFSKARAQYRADLAPGMKSVLLEWIMPRNDTTGRLSCTGKIYGLAITVDSVVDLRTRPELIGRNDEAGNEKSLDVTTRDTVAVWVKNRLLDLLRGRCLNVVASNADVLLVVKITDFGVVESDTYVAKTGMKVTIKKRGQPEETSKVIAVETSKWGRSFKLQNYYECLSQGLALWVESLVQDTDFSAAILVAPPAPVQ